MEGSTSRERISWEEDEDGNRESVRLEKNDRNKWPGPPFPRVTEEALAKKVADQEKAEARINRQLAEARRAAKEATETKDRNPMMFKAELADDPKDKPNQHVLLFDTAGSPLTRQVIREERGGDGKKLVDPATGATKYTVEAVPAELADYLPELGKMKIHIRHQKEGEFGGVRLERVGKENILWVPKKGDLTDAQVPGLIPEIIRVVIAESLKKEREKVDAKRTAVESRVKTLHREHSTAHRAHPLHEAEHKLVDAEAAYERKLEEKIREVLLRVKEEQNIDLAASVGGTDAWMRLLAHQSHDSVAPNRVEVSSPDKKTGKHGSLVYGSHHPEYKGVIGKLNEKIDQWIVEPILVDQKMVDGYYDQLEEKIQAYPDGFLNNLKKGVAGKSWRQAKRILRKGWQGPKHAVLKPASYVAAGAIGLGLSIWDITNIWPFKIAKEEIKSWGKWVADQVDLGGGKGGKGGGGGEHH